MVPISKADFQSVLRLLDALARTKGDSLREREDARKARLLVRKLKRKVIHES